MARPCRTIAFNAGAVGRLNAFFAANLIASIPNREGSMYLDQLIDHRDVDGMITYTLAPMYTRSGLRESITFDVGAELPGSTVLP